MRLIGFGLAVLGVDPCIVPAYGEPMQFLIVLLCLASDEPATSAAASAKKFGDAGTVVISSDFRAELSGGFALGGGSSASAFAM